MVHIDSKVVLFMQVMAVVGLPLLLWGPLRLGRIFPLPILQIMAGIMLGPTIFGALAPEAFNFIFGPEVRSGIETLANVALVLFVFMAGCEADRNVLKRAAGMVVSIGFTGVTVAWACGTLAAWTVLAKMSGAGIVGTKNEPILFSVAFGLCMAVTALPVLGIVLRELGFNQKPIGTIALAVGGVDDALLWTALAVLLPFASGSTNFWASAIFAVTGGVLTILAMIYVVRPSLRHLLDTQAQERVVMSVVILVLFIAAAVNQAAGLHAAIGAFLTGLFLPDRLRHLAQDRLDAPVTLLLLPFLFLATGLRTSFDLNDATVWTILGLALLVCIGGKFTGVALTSLINGQSVAFSVTLATLLQCKGLMEIVIVTILYQKGVVGAATFSALVLVALLTTALTIPAARLCVRVFGPSALETREVAPVPVTTKVPELVAETARAPGKGPVLVFEAPIGEIAMSKSDIVIGRHSQDDIRINDVRVSRHHAKIRAVDGGYEIDNLTAVRSEPNPVLVNGEAREHGPLKDGDVVSLGGVVFTFRAEGAFDATG